MGQPWDAVYILYRDTFLSDLDWVGVTEKLRFFPFGLRW